MLLLMGTLIPLKYRINEILLRIGSLIKENLNLVFALQHLNDYVSAIITDIMSNIRTVIPLCLSVRS